MCGALNFFLVDSDGCRSEVIDYERALPNYFYEPMTSQFGRQKEKWLKQTWSSLYVVVCANICFVGVFYDH